MSAGDGADGASQAGASTTPRLLFMPGLSGDGREFWQPLADLLPPAWEKTFISWPGFGPVPPSPAVDGFGDLAELVKEQLTTPAALVAQSMGTLIATTVALQAPAMVSHLVLCAAPGLIVAAPAAEDWRDLPPSEMPPAPDWARGEVPEVSQRLDLVAMPALLVWATRDAISPLVVGEELARRLPDARLLTFDSEDHWVARVHAREVAAAIESLLEG